MQGHGERDDDRHLSAQKVDIYGSEEDQASDAPSQLIEPTWTVGKGAPSSRDLMNTFRQEQMNFESEIENPVFTRPHTGKANMSAKNVSLNR